MRHISFSSRGRVDVTVFARGGPSPPVQQCYPVPTVKFPAAWQFGVVLAGLWAHLPTARADEWSLHVLLSGQLAATDNVFQVPSNSPEGLPRESDVLFQLRPGALLSYATPRTTHEFTADLDGLAYARHSEAWSISGRAGWKGFFAISPRTEMLTGVGFGTGTLNTLVARSADPAAALAPTGNSNFISADAGQQLSHQASREVRITEHAKAQAVQTTDSSDRSNVSLEAAIGGGFDRAWRFDAFGFDLTGSFVSFSRGDGSNGDDRLENIRAAGQWRHDLSRRWTSIVDGGVVVVVPLSTSGKSVVVPIIGGQLAYAPQWGAAGVSVSRSVIPNLFIAQNTVADTVSASVNMPLPWLSAERARPKWSAVGAVGFVRTQLIDTDRGQLASSFDIFSADLALQYAVSEASGLALRYQFVRQTGNADSLTIIQGYARNTLLLSFTHRFPSRQAAKFPVRSSLRVDRSDITPMGEEPGARGGPTPGPASER